MALGSLDLVGRMTVGRGLFLVLGRTTKISLGTTLAVVVVVVVAVAAVVVILLVVVASVDVVYVMTVRIVGRECGGAVSWRRDV